MKITTILHAFVSRGSTATPQQLQTEKGVQSMHFFDCKDFWIGQGYAYIGEATVMIEVPDDRTLIDSKVASLRSEAATIRADATLKCTRIEGQINQLLAIENSTAGEA